MEATKITIDFVPQRSHAETEQPNDATKEARIQVSLDNIKTPSASDAFKGRVTCQRRS